MSTEPKPWSKNNRIIQSFTNELEVLLNKYGMDMVTNIPDFILAAHLTQYLDNLRITGKLTRQWEGNPRKEDYGE